MGSFKWEGTGGLTLIETLIALAIIGILIGIVVTNVGDPTGDAKAVKIKANDRTDQLKQIFKEGLDKI